MFRNSKKNRTLFLAFTLITPLFIMAPGSPILNGLLSTPIINMNYQSLVSSGKIHHTGIITTRTSNSGGQIRLKQIFEQPAATGYKQFDHYCSSAVVADVVGRTGTVSY